MRPNSTRAKLLQIEDWPLRAAAANYGSKVFLAQVAQECGTSTKSVQRFFQEHFNKSVQQQLDEFRICKVECLAREGFLAKQILNEVGLHDASQLSHKFRNVRGISFRISMGAQGGR